MSLARSEAVLAKALDERKHERRHERRLVFSARILLLVGVIVAWQLLSGAVLDPFFFSSPKAILAAFNEMLVSGRLADNVGYTIYEAVVGYAFGAVAGILAALVIGPSPRLNAVIEPFILSIYSIPSIAMAPLLIVWFGIGVTSKVLLAAYFVFFVVFMNTVAGIRGVQRSWIDTVRVMGATKSQVMTKVVLRGAATHLGAGLRLAVPEAVIGAVVGEFISSQKGIGYLILSASAKYQTAGVFAAVFMLGVLVLVMMAGLHASTVGHARRH